MDFYKGLNIAITVSDKDGNVIYQNDSSIEVNGDARGRNLEQCHNPRSWEMIRHMIDDDATNVYTISKKGKKKLIYQTPWYDESGEVRGDNGEVKREPAGLVEFSIILPEEMPHYDRG